MRRRRAIQLCRGAPHCYGYLRLRSKHCANVRGAPMGTGGRLGRELRLDAVGRPAFALAAAGKAEVIGRMPLHQLIQHAGGRVHIDGGRSAPSYRTRYVVGQHLGGGEIGRRSQGRPPSRRQRGIRAFQRNSRSEIDENELEGALLHLIGRGKLSRIDHDIARGHITMGQAALNIGHTSQKIEQVASDAGHRKRREPPLVVHGQSASRLFERDPLHPFHHDDRILTDAAASVEAGEAAQRGQGAMGVVFGIECGSTGLGEFIVPSFAIGPPQTLEREPLATGIAGMKHLPYTASAAGGLVHQQRDEASLVGVAMLGGDIDRRLERLDPNKSHGTAAGVIGQRTANGARL